MDYKPLTDDVLTSMLESGYADRHLVEQARRANRCIAKIIERRENYCRPDDAELWDVIADYLGEEP